VSGIGRPIHTEAGLVAAAVWPGGWGLTAGEHGVSSGVMEMFYYEVVMVTQL
jgi:hypothetical protein